MSHLGSRLSALVDGRLSPAETERALEHVAGCAACAHELAEARAARRALLDAAHVEPAPDLTARLLALSTQIPPAADDPLRRPPSGAEPWGAQPAVLPRGAWSGELRSRSVRRRVVAVLAGGVGVAAVGLFALGDSPTVTPSLHRMDPVVALAQAAPASTIGRDGADGAAVLASLDEDGWASPTHLPDGTSVVAVRQAAGVLEIDLRTPAGEVVVREQPGVLDGAALAGLDTWDVDGRTVHVLSDEPWHVVWQSGDTVVDVASGADREHVLAVVAAFPARDYDAGVPARISRGWTTMTGALGTS
ncbi:zf-HC2 domain-containing protein [Cellulosimicrobium marinum]|uniref:zf-HC2 domain-containing protein n=1 Tax=Cellulosimicrobium marinum TaxID=1638992 RepID=UPI001E38A52D|nr:zf-HC2 domain-containing protein [Cellulosimicrobium marinum]MCB7136506.1 zf-HC2 domain-containing protein [Cellulosimicrobium marinum]